MLFFYKVEAIPYSLPSPVLRQKMTDLATKIFLKLVIKVHLHFIIGIEFII